jgi:hypothetical protein
MATATEVTAAHIEASLRDLTAEMDFLPEMASEWETEPEDNRLNYALEWDELMDRLDGLGRAHRQGRMTPNQQAQYRDLLCKLADMRPFISKLNLRRPPVSLDA